MSKKVKKNGEFNYKPTAILPNLNKIKTEWDLKKHFYTNENDSQIEADAKIFENAVNKFSKKYSETDFTKSLPQLLTSLKEYENLERFSQASKIFRYFMFRTNTNVNDTAASKRINLFSERFKVVENKLLFFSLRIGKIPKTVQGEILSDKKFQKYHYLLSQIFEQAKHQLTEAEERILRLRSNTSSGMWAEATDKIVSNRILQFKNESLSIPEALEKINTLNWSDKQKLWTKILDEMISISEFAEHELTAIVTHKKVSDDLRGYKKPYSATVQSYENTEKSVEALVEAISTKGFALSKKFYKLKARIHKQESIPYVNKYDPIGTLRSISFERAVEICRDTFYSINGEYGKVFDEMLVNGQIDVYPKKGKRGGAFMAGTIGLPTFVMLNHTPTFKSLETLAHEMGHAVHSEMSKKQPEIYQEFSTTTAETASTLFEQLTLEKILEQLPPEEERIFLHDKITRDIATVQRQIAFFNFELKMHNHIREQGLATKEELAEIMENELKRYLGPAVEVTKKDGYSYVYIPHVRYGFYVYTYTYGHLMSNLMAQKYKADNSYKAEIHDFLSSGGNDTVENIFRKINIDASKIETFTDSLSTQAKEIALLEKLS